MHEVRRVGPRRVGPRAHRAVERRLVGVGRHRHDVDRSAQPLDAFGAPSPTTATTVLEVRWAVRRMVASGPVDPAAASRPPATPPLHLHHHGSIPRRRPGLRPRLRCISITTGRFRGGVPASGHASAASPSPRVDSAAASRPPATPPLRLHQNRRRSSGAPGAQLLEVDLHAHDPAALRRTPSPAA